MAIHCFKIGQIDPFQNAHRVYLMSGSRSNEMSHHGEGSVEDAMRTEAGRAKLEAQEKVNEAILKKESMRKLNEMIQSAPSMEAEIILQNVDKAIVQAGAIERLADVFTPEETELAWEQLASKYGDLKLTESEIRELTHLRDEAEQRIYLMEAHMVNDVQKLEAYALLFVRDENGKPIPGKETSLPAGKTFKLDFKDPKTGEINTFAEQKLTLGHILKAVGRKFVTVMKADGRELPAYLHSDGKTYDREEGKSGRKYVAILQGDEFTTPEKKPEAVASAEPKAASLASNAPGEPYNPDFRDNSLFMDADQLAAAQAEETRLLEQGGTAYHKPSEVYVGSPTTRTKEASLDEDQFTTTLWKDEEDADWEWDAPLSTNGGETNTEVDLAELSGMVADVPEHFRGENSYEAISKIKYLEGGKEIYDAIRMMAAIHREVQGPIDNRTMWENLRGGLFSKGGNWKISFNEIAKAVYGKNEQKLEESFPHFDAFKKASYALLTLLPDAEETDVDANTYKAQREAVEYTGEKKTMAEASDHFFERNSYGPPISVGAFRAIVYALSPKDRPTIDEDSWMTPAARSKAAKGYKTYGETEVISHSRAFDKLMESGDLNAYVAKLNMFLNLGEAHIKAERANLGSKREKKQGFEVEDFTLEQITANFTPTEDQIMAVRHGMMIQAAADLGVYQKVKAETEPSGDSMEAAVLEAAKAEGLDDAAAAEVLANAEQQLYGVVGAYVATHDINNLDEWASYSAGLSAGVQYELGHGFKLEFLVSGNTVAPVLRGSLGLTYNIAFGKEKRWHFDAYAKAVAGLSDPSGFMGPVVGAGLSYEIGESRIVSADLGAHASLESTGLSLGANRNLGRVLERRIDEYETVNSGGLSRELQRKVDRYKRRHPDETLRPMLQRRVDRFHEKHPDKIGPVKEEAYAAIDALDVSAAQKAQLKAAYDQYLDRQIAANVTDDFTVWYKQVKFAGAGLMGAVGWKEGGYAVGPYITLGIGFRPVTLYVPPLETPEQVSESMRTGLPLETAEYKAPEPDWIRVDITDEVLWSGDSASETKAKEQAAAESTQAFEALSQGVAADALLTPGDRYTNLEIKNLNGSVQLYVDSRSGIEVVQDGPQGLALNLDRDDNLLIRILEIPAAQGGDPIMVVGITNDPSASLGDIASNSGNILTWNQTPDGKKSDSSLMNNPNAVGADSIFTRSDLEDLIESGDKDLGDLSPEGTAARIREVKAADLEARDGVREARLFEELSEADKALAKKIADQLINQEGIDYDALATSDRNEEINTKIIELYRTAFDAAGDTSKEVTVDHVYYARQYAMEMGRPSHTHVPLGWNEKAFREAAGEFSEIASDYFEKNKAEILSGALKGEFPEGTEFFIYINEKGEMKVLQGYYDQATHGDMLAPIKWDAKNPKASLDALGLEDNPGNQEAVREIAAAIDQLNWQETELNTSESATFAEVMDTMAGVLLLSEADALYGNADASTLRNMVMSGSDSANPTLAKEFAEDVVELIKNKTGMVRGNVVNLEWETRSALYSKCFNLVLGRNMVLKYVPPSKKTVQAASTRDRVEQGMNPEETVRYTQIRVAPGLIPIKVTPDVPADQEGSGNEDNSANEGETEGGDGASSGNDHPSLGDEDAQ